MHIEPTPYPMLCDDGTPLASLDEPIPYRLADEPRARAGYFKVIPAPNEPKRALLDPIDGVFTYANRTDKDDVRIAYERAVTLVGRLAPGARVVAFNPPAAGRYPALAGAVG